MHDLKAISTFLDIAPDPMMVVDSGGVIVFASAYVYELFGYVPDELTGKPVEHLLPERCRSAHGNHLENFFRSPSVRPMGTGLELSARRADGSEFPVEISLSPLRDGDAPYALASIRDITERKRLEESRRETRKQKRIAEERAKAARILSSRNDALHAIFEASPLGMVTTTPDGIIDRWNHAAEGIYGYTASEAIGTSIWDMGGVMGGSEEQGAPVTVVDAKKRIVHELRDFHSRQRRRDGKIIDISLSSAEYRDANGENSGYIFLSDDISERKMVDQQLRQAQKMEAVGQLTGGIAHDFNNLLSIIILNLELSREKIPAHSEHVALNESALTAALHGADLVKQILAFARKQNLSPKRIEVNELVKSMTSLLTRALGEQVEIVLHTAPEAWPAIADPVQLQTALLNLATNARDAMARGGRLTIQTENVSLDEAYVQQFGDLKAGEYVMVAVSDSGQGMAPETVERAFDPFFTTKPAGVGTGLGLSMVFGFVKQSEGHVRIYSETGHGTTVRVYLPRAGTERPAAAPPPKTFAHTRKSKAPRVLIVEDNAALAKTAYRLLSNAGFDATVASGAKEALNLLRVPSSFDVLFTDIILASGENGFELAKEATRLDPRLKVLYASGFAEAALLESGHGAAEGNFISKPYRSEDLISRIESMSTDAEAQQPEVKVLS